jgi:hypothetical protein
MNEVDPIPPLDLVPAFQRPLAANGARWGAGSGHLKRVPAPTLIENHPELRPPLVHGLLRIGEVMNINADPKVGKSFLAHMLAGAVASGSPWLGKRAEKGRVLILDAELHAETLAYRLGRMRMAMGLSPEDLLNIDVVTLRGRWLGIDELYGKLANVEPGHYSLLLLDALYRFMAFDAKENSNDSMRQAYNALDKLAEGLRAAIGVIHHNSKGNQGDKAITDVGAGGGAQSRAADTHLIIREHEEQGGAVVDAALRSWPRMAPFCIRWTDPPGWELAPDLDPEQIKRPRAKSTAKAAGEKWVGTDAEWCDEFVGKAGRSTTEIIAAATENGMMSGRDATARFRRSKSNGLIFLLTKPKGQRYETFSVERPPAPTESPKDC